MAADASWVSHLVTFTGKCEKCERVGVSGAIITKWLTVFEVVDGVSVFNAGGIPGFSPKNVRWITRCDSVDCLESNVCRRNVKNDKKVGY